ncbi:MAG: biosynthetic peptidoglycan transglycosylase [Pyrinomonadaceae bacterium]
MSFISWRKILVFFGLLVGIIFVYIAFFIIQAYLAAPNIIAESEAKNLLPIKLEDVPKDYLDALIRVEDPNFYDHNGIDISTKGAGWTTITQGLVKIYFYKDFSPGFLKYRKINQTLTAYGFNKSVDKDTQLRLFINSVYLGNVSQNKEIIGFQAAAKEYFGKNVGELSKDEFLALTAMIVAPNDLSVRTRKTENQERVRRIKKLLNGECEPQSLSDVYYESCK